MFPLDQVPEMARGSGVILQRYKDGELSDVKVFRLADGLTWKLGDRVRTETDLRPWLAERGTAGRLPPNGFPRPPNSADDLAGPSSDRVLTGRHPVRRRAGRETRCGADRIASDVIGMLSLHTIRIVHPSGG